VLYRTTMPSILIECGFISNYNEEAYLKSDKGQNYIASAIYRAFRITKRLWKHRCYQGQFRWYRYEEIVAPPDSTTSHNNPDSLKIKKDTTTALQTNPQPKTEIKAQDVILRVQIVNSDKNCARCSQFNGLKEIFEYRSGDFYKYTSGKFTSIADAFFYLKDVRAKGFKDAFVVASTKPNASPWTMPGNIWRTEFLKFDYEILWYVMIVVGFFVILLKMNSYEYSGC